MISALQQYKTNKEEAEQHVDVGNNEAIDMTSHNDYYQNYWRQPRRLVRPILNTLSHFRTHLKIIFTYFI